MGIANEYYQNYSVAKSVAGVIYGISWSLNKSNLDFFWLWVLGITDQYVHSKITNVYYDEEIPVLQQAHFEVNKTPLIQEENQNEEEKGDLKFDSKGLFYKNIKLETD